MAKPQLLQAHVEAEPNPVAAFSSVTIVGTGWKPNHPVALILRQPWPVYGNPLADGNGNFRIATPTRGQGIATIEAEQTEPRGRGRGKPKLIAEAHGSYEIV